VKLVTKQNKQEIFILFYFILARQHMCNKNLKNKCGKRDLFNFTFTLFQRVRAIKTK